MSRVFALTLMCVVCLGCKSGGQSLAGTAFSPATPAASGAPANNVAANQADANGTDTVAGTIGRIWKAVGFQQPVPKEPAPVSPEMARFNGFISAISTQTSQLNINDPPEVTRQKAQGILTTLRDWDSVLAAGRSVGVINDATATLLTNSVQRLSAETEKLLQYSPNPETINAIQQIGGRLGAAYSSVQGILSQGASVSQALLGGGNGLQ